MMYRIYDSCGEPLRQRFSTKYAAYSFIALMGRTDWQVKQVTN